MFNQTVTIYNKYEIEGLEKWNRKVIHNVFYDEIDGQQLNKLGENNSNSLKIIIRKSHVGPGYVSPEFFKNAPDKEELWTIAKGDTIVLGESNIEIKKSIKELEKKYLINTVDFKNFHSVMAHWEVGAK